MVPDTSWPPWNQLHGHHIDPDPMTRKPTSEPYGRPPQAIALSTIDSIERPSVGSTSAFHFDERHTTSVGRFSDDVYLVAAHDSIPIEDSPASETQPSRRDTFALDSGTTERNQRPSL